MLKLNFSKIKDINEFNIEIWWSKNTTLPLILFAYWISLKYKIDILLENVAILEDVFYEVEFVKNLWWDIVFDKKKKTIFISKKSKITNKISSELYWKFRLSILSLWLILSFFDEVNILKETWWCLLWSDRKNDIVYNFFERIWFDVYYSSWGIIVKKWDKFKTKNKVNFKLSINSTSATENILLYLALNPERFEKIKISNLYLNRPDINEIMKFLLEIWINIEIEWNSIIWVEKNISIDSFNFKIISDFDQVLFYIFLWIVAKKNIILNNFYNDYPYLEYDVIKRVFWYNVFIKKEGIFKINWLNLKLGKKNIEETFEAKAYPFLMSDSQPILSLISIFVKKIRIIDKRFQYRYKYLDYYLNFFDWSFSLTWNSLIFEITSDDPSPRFGKYDIFAVREWGLLLLLWIYKKVKLTITWEKNILRWYEDIFNVLWKIFEDFLG